MPTKWKILTGKLCNISFHEVGMFSQKTLRNLISTKWKTFNGKTGTNFMSAILKKFI